jgi:hypothetical protein
VSQFGHSFFFFIVGIIGIFDDGEFLFIDGSRLSYLGEKK